MQLSGTYSFKASRQLVWDTLQSPEVIATCMPGCQSFLPLGEDRYEATMKLSLGPVNGTFSGQVALLEPAAPERYRMSVEGGGGPGQVRGSGVVELRDAEDGSTVVSYAGEAHVTGKIASVGQRLLSVTARQLINQFFKCMEKRLESGETVAAAGQPAPPVDATTPGISAAGERAPAITEGGADASRA